jgi:hypothetical protein
MKTKSKNAAAVAAVQARQARARRVSRRRGDGRLGYRSAATIAFASSAAAPAAAGAAAAAAAAPAAVGRSGKHLGGDEAALAASQTVDERTTKGNTNTTQGNRAAALPPWRMEEILRDC